MGKHGESGEQAVRGHSSLVNGGVLILCKFQACFRPLQALCYFHAGKAILFGKSTGRLMDVCFPVNLHRPLALQSPGLLARRRGDSERVFIVVHLHTC